MVLLLLLPAGPLNEGPEPEPPQAPHAAALDRQARLSPGDSTPADDRIDVRANGRLDLRFRDVGIFDALELLSDQTDRNIVVENGVAGSVSLLLRQVTFDEALLAIVRSSNLTYETRDGIIYVSAAKSSAEGGDGPRSAGRGEGAPREVRVFRLNYVTAMAAEDFIKPLLGEDGTITRTGELKEGIESDKESAGGFSAAGREILVVIAPQSRMKLIETALAEFDTRPPQVLVEATIMRATLNDQNALGIDFNTLLGVDLQMLTAVSPGVTDLSVGNVPFDRLDNFNSTLRTDFNDRVPSGGITFGIVKDQIATFVRALEQITDVSILANPKLLVLNKQRGEVIVGRRDGYQTTTVTETAAIQTVEYLETGTKLVFRPLVTGNGEVRMEIHPEDSNGGLTAANLPFQETTEATTNVMLRDGHTILIGGLFRERTNIAKSQVPVVGNVPVIGPLFGVQQDQTVREEVIILLTVHVLNDSESEDAKFAGVTDDIERVRVGARMGLMGTGREVIAEARYRQALDELRAGATEKALESVRTSLRINPRNLDAMRLQEQLENDRTWRATGTQMRAFLQEMLREQKGLPGRPVLGLPQVEAIDGGRNIEPAAEASAPAAPPSGPAAEPAGQPQRKSAQPGPMYPVPGGYKNPTPRPHSSSQPASRGLEGN